MQRSQRAHLMKIEKFFLCKEQSGVPVFKDEKRALRTIGVLIPVDTIIKLGFVRVVPAIKWSVRRLHGVDIVYNNKENHILEPLKRPSTRLLHDTRPTYETPKG